MRIVNLTVLVFLLVVCAQISGVRAESAPATRPDPHTVLTTKSFKVSITDKRREGDVAGEAIYYGVSRSTGESIRLRGSDWHSAGRDGTPGRFIGYKFTNGKVTYLVYEEGRLEVIGGDSEVLVDEAGSWNE